MKLKLKKVTLLTLIICLLGPSFGTLSAQETLSSDYEEEMQSEVMESAPEFEEPIPEIEEITEASEDTEPLESTSKVEVESVPNVSEDEETSLEEETTEDETPEQIIIDIEMMETVDDNTLFWGGKTAAGLEVHVLNIQNQILAATESDKEGNFEIQFNHPLEAGEKITVQTFGEVDNKAEKYFIVQEIGILLQVHLNRL